MERTHPAPEPTQEETMTNPKLPGARALERREQEAAAQPRVVDRGPAHVDPESDALGEAGELDRLRISIGLRLRELRSAQGMSVRTLARKVGLTSGFISQIENGRQMPSIATLVRLCAALDIEVGDMFDESAAHGRVVRPADRTVYSWERGVRDEVVSADSTKTLEMLCSTFAPGGTTGEPFTHGSEIEVAFVIEGILRVSVGDNLYELQTGDALTFSGGLPHSVSNPGTEQARVIWALTPGTF
jgi:transcriptional regulator with XRE-family HTH domain